MILLCRAGFHGFDGREKRLRIATQLAPKAGKTARQNQIHRLAACERLGLRCFSGSKFEPRLGAVLQKTRANSGAQAEFWVSTLTIRLRIALVSKEGTCGGAFCQTGRIKIPKISKIAMAGTTAQMGKTAAIHRYGCKRTAPAGKGKALCGCLRRAHFRADRLLKPAQLAKTFQEGRPRRVPMAATTGKQ